MATGIGSTFEDHVFYGSIVFAGQMAFPTGAVTDNSVAAAANLAASKLEHQYEPHYSQPFAQSATVERKPVHVVKGATGTIVDFRVGATTAAIGAATATIDLKKNGVSVLTATISLTSATAAFATIQPGAYTSLALVAGDVLEVDVTAATAGGGTLAKGLFAQLIVREKAQ